jgi:hypothetical protein
MTHERRFATANYRIAKGLLDDLVRGHLKGLRHGEAERFGGLEIDRQFEFRGLLDGKIGGLCAL